MRTRSHIECVEIHGMRPGVSAVVAGKLYPARKQLGRAVEQDPHEDEPVGGFCVRFRRHVNLQTGAEGPWEIECDRLWCKIDEGCGCGSGRFLAVRGSKGQLS